MNKMSRPEINGFTFFKYSDEAADFLGVGHLLFLDGKRDSILKGVTIREGVRGDAAVEGVNKASDWGYWVRRDDA